MGNVIFYGLCRLTEALSDFLAVVHPLMLLLKYAFMPVSQVNENACVLGEAQEILMSLK